MLRRVILGAALVLGFTPQAQAAQGAQCLIQQMPENAQAAALRAIERNSSRLTKPLTDAITICATEHGWDEQKTLQALTIMTWQLTANDARRDAVRHGATDEQLTNIQQQLVSVGFRLTAAGLASDTEDGTPFFDSIRAVGLQLDGSYLSDIMTWLASLSEAEDQMIIFERL